MSPARSRPCCRPRVLLWIALGAAACDAGDDLRRGPGFMVTSNGAEAQLEVAGDHDWSWNAMPDRTYRGWSAAFAETSWRRQTAAVELTVVQSADGALAAGLTVGRGRALRFGDGELGPGWRALRGVPPARRFDLRAAGLVPEGRPVGDVSVCELDDTRMRVALSSYPGSMDDLIGLAAAPATWLELVRDDRLYDLR